MDVDWIFSWGYALTMFPRIPEADIRLRAERLMDAVLSNGLSASLISHFINLYYFTGSAQMGFFIAFESGDFSHLVIRDYVRASEESLWDVEPIKGMKDLISFLKGKGVKRLGIEGDKVPYSLARFISNSLGCELVDISKDIRIMRSVKSDYEVAMLREACRIEDEVFKRACEIIREGVTEMDVDGELRRVSRVLGHQGILRMHGWNQEMIQSHVYSGPNGCFISYIDAPITGPGLTPAVPQGGSFRVLRRGEPIIIDFGVGYNGYIADQTRTFSIGKLPDKFLKAFDVCLEIVDMLESRCKEGVNSKDAFLWAEDIAEKRDLSNHFMGYGKTRVNFVGHGVGLEIDEFPVLARGFSMELKSGMVFAFEPKMVFPGEGAVGIESMYLVKPNGVERLPKTEHRIFEL